MSIFIFKKVKEKEKKRQSLILQISKMEKMVRGSFCEIYVKCGKKNCKCQNGEKHPHKRMSLREGGRSYSRAVPKEEYIWIGEMTNNYRKYREIRRMINKIENEIKELLDEYEDLVVQTTRKGKTYLEVGNT